MSGSSSSHVTRVSAAVLHSITLSIETYLLNVSPTNWWSRGKMRHELRRHIFVLLLLLFVLCMHRFESICASRNNANFKSNPRPNNTRPAKCASVCWLLVFDNARRVETQHANQLSLIYGWTSPPTPQSPCGLTWHKRDEARVQSVMCNMNFTLALLLSCVESARVVFIESSRSSCFSVYLVFARSMVTPRLEEADKYITTKSLVVLLANVWFVRNACVH